MYVGQEQEKLQCCPCVAIFCISLLLNVQLGNWVGSYSYSNSARLQYAKSTDSEARSSMLSKPFLQTVPVSAQNPHVRQRDPLLALQANPRQIPLAALFRVASHSHDPFPYMTTYYIQSKSFTLTSSGQDCRLYFIQSSNCLLCHRHLICVLLRKCPKNVVTCGFVTVSVTTTAIVCDIQGPFRFAGHIRMGQDERADADGQRRRRRLGLQDRRASSALARDAATSFWLVCLPAPSSVQLTAPKQSKCPWLA